MLRVWLLVLFVVIGTSRAQAANQLATDLVVNPACGVGCPLDSLAKAYLKISPTNVTGSNGLKFKLKITGASLNGSPALIGYVNAVILLSIAGGPCTAYYSPPFGIPPYGIAGLQFTAGNLQPPGPAFPESPGAAVSFCNEGVYLDTGTHHFAIAGILLGNDAD